MKRKTSRTEKPASALLQSKPNPSQRILMVEDDRNIRRLNAEKLINSGYHVDAAKDGAVAWKALQLNSYNLLITNQYLPKVSGDELLFKIHEARISLPIILATRNLPTWEFTLHPWLLPATMLLKPYTYEKLLATVKNVLYAIASARAPLFRLTQQAEFPAQQRIAARCCLL